MSHEIDISFIDKPEILQKIFPLSHNLSFGNIPQSDPNADAYFIDVAEGVRVCCKFYSDDAESPSILFFHSGHETSLSQSELGSRLNRAGINFFVTDYRGYGISDGEPSMTNLFQDCHKIYSYFKQILKNEQYNPVVFVMGSSVGSMPAIELAYHYQDEIKGLIIESGTAQNFKALWANEDPEKIKQLSDSKFYNKEKIKEISIPTLFLHGEIDNLIPVQIAKAMYEISPAENKRLVLIPGAGHTDLRETGYNEYYPVLEDFVKKNL